ncbi:MAG: M50 family metallopeptidase [Deltaproteobacteria bacterium]|nr:M50 family metallopeptidase [Deltaproteobacteria bacterium]
MSPEPPLESLPGVRAARERRGRLRLLLGVAATTLLGILLWESPLLLPLKLLTVLFHELGHALAAIAMGGSAESISVNFLQGGLTRFRLPDALLPRMVVASAGYLGSALSGAALLLLFGRERRLLTPTRVIGALGLGLLVVAVLYLRDPTSWTITLPLALVLLGGARWLPDELLRSLGIVLATFVSLYALFDLRSDVLRLPWEEGPSQVTDAVALADLTHLPALFWAVLWTIAAIVLLLGTLGWLARSRNRTAP